MTELGLTFIMISGEGDMSFSGMYSLLTTIFALQADKTNNFIASFLIILGVSLVVNMMISTLVTRLSFSSFIISIAFMFMANGIEASIHKQTALITTESFTNFIKIEFGFALIVWVMLAAFAVAFFLVHKTKFGFQLRITGENADAAI